MEEKAEIEEIVMEVIGKECHKRAVRKDTLVYEMFGKMYRELTEEEQREYWVEKHKREMQDESKKIAKREYERERYKRRQEYFRMRAKERYAAKKGRQKHDKA